jgi:hypothetical protein
VDNKGEPRQSPAVVVSVEATFFAVSGSGCNALMEASGPMTAGHPRQLYNLTW